MRIFTLKINSNKSEIYLNLQRALLIMDLEFENSNLSLSPQLSWILRRSLVSIFPFIFLYSFLFVFACSSQAETNATAFNNPSLNSYVPESVYFYKAPLDDVNLVDITLLPESAWKPYFEKKLEN